MADLPPPRNILNPHLFEKKNNLLADLNRGFDASKNNENLPNCPPNSSNGHAAPQGSSHGVQEAEACTPGSSIIDQHLVPLRRQI